VPSGHRLRTFRGRKFETGFEGRDFVSFPPTLPLNKNFYSRLFAGIAHDTGGTPFDSKVFKKDAAGSLSSMRLAPFVGLGSDLTISPSSIFPFWGYAVIFTATVIRVILQPDRPLGPAALLAPGVAVLCVEGFFGEPGGLRSQCCCMFFSPCSPSSLDPLVESPFLDDRRIGVQDSFC